MFWKVHQDRRVFVQFAKKRGFDPASADSWYKVRRDIIASKVYISNHCKIIILLKYQQNLGKIVRIQGSFKKTLAILFPEIYTEK